MEEEINLGRTCERQFSLLNEMGRIAYLSRFRR